MSAKLSPWPWRYSFRSVRSSNLGVYDSVGYLLASIDVHQLSNAATIERRQADARVMAAGPELLEALRDLLAVAPHQAPGVGIVGMKERHAAAINTARAAIAKAEGKE